jgi:hypothetical protein
MLVHRRGWAEQGQLGPGISATSVPTPIIMQLGGGVVPTSVAAGSLSTCLTTTAGSVQCYGDNINGQASPPALSTAVAVIVGSTFSCALLQTKSVRCWGIANGAFTPPILLDPSFYDGTGVLPGLSTNTVALAGNNVHTCALQLSGAVYCW